jgi:hypothetical protein
MDKVHLRQISTPFPKSTILPAEGNAFYPIYKSDPPSRSLAAKIDWEKHDSFQKKKKTIIMIGRNDRPRNRDSDPGLGYSRPPRTHAGYWR